MNTLKRSALVPYTSRQMFELVNNIEDYPRFLPWCGKSTVLTQTDEEVVAELEISWKGMSKSFSTRNQLFPYTSMEISLVKGPMKRMKGKWDFIDVDGSACKVMLDLEFEFAGGFIDMLFEPVFQSIANSLVDAFCKRAVEVYGKAKSIQIEVAYALPERQSILMLSVPEGCSIREALELSGILQLYPEIDLTRQKVGVFSKKRELSDTVAAGERIEIYRPLTIDPKEARRAKAKKKVNVRSS